MIFVIFHVEYSRRQRALISLKSIDAFLLAAPNLFLTCTRTVLSLSNFNIFAIKELAEEGFPIESIIKELD